MLILGIAGFAVKGVFRGFFREVFGLLALVGGVGASAALGGAAGRELASRWALDPRLARPLAYAALFLIPFVTLNAAGYLLQRLGRATFLGGVDRVTGGLFGLTSGALLAGALLSLAVRYDWGRAWVEESRLARPLTEAFHRAVGWVAELGP